MGLYSVSILFDDGSYHANVQADNDIHAYNLALIDARISNTFGTHWGKVVKKDVKWAGVVLEESNPLCGYSSYS